MTVPEPTEPAYYRIPAGITITVPMQATDVPTRIDAADATDAATTDDPLSTASHATEQGS